MPWMSWSPKGDRLAYFVRTEKERTLIVQNVLTRKIEVRIPMKTVDEPESPSFSPDGRTVAFAALRGGVGDIFTLDLETKRDRQPDERRLRRLRRQRFSRDGKFLIYNARVSGNQKLFRLDLDTKKKTQITFGTVDETAAQFIDDHTIVFSSTATDPAVPLDPEVARNGNIYNIWTLDLRTGELRQFTDVLGGNWSPVVLNEGQTNRIAFISYYKGEYSIRTLERKEPLHTAASADFGAPGPIIDFQAPLQHTLDRGQRAQEEAVREDVSRGTAAGQRRRHEQRRHLRRIADQLRRRDRRSAVQRLHRVDLAVPDAGRVVRQPLAALPVRAPGLLADDVLLRADQRRLLRPGVFGRSSTATPRRRPGPSAAERRSGSIRSIAIAVSSSPAASSSSTRSTTTPASERLADQYQQQTYGQPLFSNGIDDPARRRVRPGNDGLPRVRTARRQHGAAGVRRRRPSIGEPAVAPDHRRRSAALPAARHHRPAGDALQGVQELRRLPGLHVLRRQLRTARLRLPAVLRAERGLRQRGAALPADRGGAHADRRHRRHPRRVLRQHRRRLVRRPAEPDSLQRGDAATSSGRTTTRNLPADSRAS